MPCWCRGAGLGPFESWRPARRDPSGLDQPANRVSDGLGERSGLDRAPFWRRSRRTGCPGAPARSVPPPPGRFETGRLSGKGLPVRYVHLDITDEAAWTEVVAAIEEQDGGLDVLVNNAGIIRVSTLTQLELSDWNLIQRVNATSVLLGIKAVAPTMIRRGGGSIINIASTAAHRGAEGYGAYSASKAAILALTRGRPRTRPARHSGQLDQPRWRGHSDEQGRTGRQHLVRCTARPTRSPRSSRFWPPTAPPT
jgi:NAD(P)-dependent dehydrogenase (short-subunit alcohol dehydrogenase family)